VAARYGKEDIVNLLLSKGDDANTKSRAGRTPLHEACKYGHVAVAKLLLEQYGAKIEAPDEDGKTPLHLACDYGKDAVAKLLLEAESVAINTRDIHGKTPLHLATAGGHEDIVRLLCQRKASIEPDEEKITPLHFAASKGLAKIVQLLLETASPTDITAVDQGGWTALHHAASQKFNGQCKIVSQLLDKEKDLLEKTSTDGQTALFIAAYYGNAEVVQLFLKKKKPTQMHPTKPKTRQCTLHALRAIN